MTLFTPLVTFTIAGKLDSKSNARVHWRTRHRASKLQRQHAAYATLSAFRTLRQDPMIWFLDAAIGVVTVRLIRCSPRKLDDDNLRDAFKSMRDGIADQFGVADNNKRLAFDYAQEHATAPHVRIEIGERP